MLNYSYSETDKILMWIGQVKEDAPVGSDVPAWAFMIEQES